MNAFVVCLSLSPQNPDGFQMMAATSVSTAILSAVAVHKLKVNLVIHSYPTGDKFGSFKSTASGGQSASRRPKMDVT